MKNFVIHHINGNYFDNRIENLFIFYNVEYKDEYKLNDQSYFLRHNKIN